MWRTLIALGSFLLAAETPADLAVESALRQSDAAIVHVKILKRVAISAEMDLVAAIGSPKEWPFEAGRLVPWTAKHKLGLFLQERNAAGRVYPLAIRAGSDGCVARVERLSNMDALIACTGDDVQSTPMNHEFFYNLREKTISAELEHAPFRMTQAFSDKDGEVFIGSDSQRTIAIEYRHARVLPFRVLSDTEAARWTPVEPPPAQFGAFRLDFEKGNSFGPRPVIAGPGGAHYELPQSTYDAFAAARPERVKNNYVGANTEFDERIGPHQVKDGKLWFGKSFYDGEGDSGVGGLGYFDPADRKYHLFAPPEMAAWSVSAILVEPDSVWAALVQRGEYGGPSGGIIRFDLRTKTVRKFALSDFGEKFLRAGAGMLVATSTSVAVIRGSTVTRYLIVPARQGGFQVVEAAAQ